jgi:hypothetical protein
VALVIDASSPATTTGAGGTNTTGSFTPPADPLLLNMWAADNAGGSADPSTISSSPGQTWAADAFSAYNTVGPNTVRGQSAIWHATPVGSTGPMTVSVTNWATGYTSFMQLFVITGHDPVAPLGHTGPGWQLSGSSVSASYTGTIDGGQGFLVICDWAAGSSAGVTAASGCTILFKGTLPGSISYYTVQRTIPDGVAGATTTLGVSGLVTGGEYHWCYAEVISVEAAAASRGSPYRQQQALASAQY